MSQRSIIEINHDVPGQVPGDQGRLYELLMRAIASGSDESWKPLERYGFRRITQCHHSEDRKVVVADREYPFG
jgi:hypothetical protein